MAPEICILTLIIKECQIYLKFIRLKKVQWLISMVVTLHLYRVTKAKIIIIKIIHNSNLKHSANIKGLCTQQIKALQLIMMAQLCLIVKMDFVREYTIQLLME